jgi:hypothetical protein
MRRLFIVAGVFLIFMQWNCTRITGPGLDNPVDSTGTNFIPPVTTLLEGPDEGETITNHTVIFRWTGNETAVEYFYLLDAKATSAWTTDTMITYDYLDEGEHNFSVWCRNSAGVLEENITVHQFIVDAVKGPTLRFFPRKIEIATNSVFNVYVFAEEVENLAGVSIDIPFDISLFELQDYAILKGSTDFLAKNAEDLLTVEENTNSEFKVSIGRVSSDSPAVSGSGAILKLTMKFKGTSESQLTFGSACRMQNPDLVNIPLSDTVPCTVRIEE